MSVLFSCQMLRWRRTYKMGLNRFLTYFYVMLLICNICNLGMMVDLAHVSADTMRAVLEVSRAPIMFSHSSARSVSNVTRNVPDDVLEMVVGNLIVLDNVQNLWFNKTHLPICNLKPFKVKTYIFFSQAIHLLLMKPKLFLQNSSTAVKRCDAIFRKLFASIRERLFVLIIWGDQWNI